MSYTELIDYNKITTELTVFLRNANIFTTTQRGVTTRTDTGTFTSASSHTLATTPTLVKNVRSVTIGGTLLVVLFDYTVNYVTGVITFVSAKTGAYTILYDTGSSDKIYPDFPRTELNINNYPRISVDIIDTTTESGGFGNANMSNIDFTVVVYDTSIYAIKSYITAIRSAFINNRDFLRSQLGIIVPTRSGPILSAENRNQKIFQQNIDFRGKLKLEVV